MHARVSTYAGLAPDRADEGVQAFQASTEALQQLDGFEGGYLLMDRDGGKAMTITLWSSEATADASAEQGKQIRTEAASAVDLTVESVDTYEVAMQVQPGR